MINVNSLKRILKIVEKLDLPIKKELSSTINKLEELKIFGIDKAEFPDVKFHTDNKHWNINGCFINSYYKNTVFRVELSSGRLSSTSYKKELNKYTHIRHGRMVRKQEIKYFWLQEKLL